MILYLIASIYLDLLAGHPNLAKQGEIEIITDATRIEEIEQLQAERLSKRGSPASCSKVGVVAEDNYIIWLRDAVRFPKGAYGTYDRILWRSALDGFAGVAVLPILSDGKILLNVNFRHATRSWEIELPRGARNEGEEIEEAARRELREETGRGVQTLTFLGTIAPDSGILGSLIPIYAGWVGSSGDSHHDESEAIEGQISCTTAEIRAALVRGYLEVQIAGETLSVPVRDSFLAYALLQAETLGLLNF